MSAFTCSRCLSTDSQPGELRCGNEDAPALERSEFLPLRPLL